MDNQIEVNGWLGRTSDSSEEAIYQVDATFKEKEAALVSKVSSGSYPQTNEVASYQIVSLGIIICLIVLIIWKLKNLSMVKNE